MWPFKNQAKNISDLPKIGSDCHQWGIAKSGFDSSPLIIRYNQTAKEWIGHPALPVKLAFAIPLNSPVEGGLPSPDENVELNGIEDIITKVVSNKTIAMYALALTTGLMKEYVFYIPSDADIRAIHESIQASVETHTVQCIGEREPKWESYVQFTPE